MARNLVLNEVRSDSTNPVYLPIFSRYTAIHIRVWLRSISVLRISERTRNFPQRCVEGATACTQTAVVRAESRCVLQHQSDHDESHESSCSFPANTNEVSILVIEVTGHPYVRLCCNSKSFRSFVLGVRTVINFAPAPAPVCMV